MYACWIVAVAKYFIISLTSFLPNKLITKSESSLNGVYKITAPAGSAKLICNFQDQNPYFLYNKNDLSLNILNNIVKN